MSLNEVIDILLEYNFGISSSSFGQAVVSENRENGYFLFVHDWHKSTANIHLVEIKVRKQIGRNKDYNMPIIPNNVLFSTYVKSESDVRKFIKHIYHVERKSKLERCLKK